MSNNVVNRVGQIDQAGAADALFLKVFGGEIIKTFDETNVMMPLHMVRTISSGKSAQFPVMGTAAAAYHTPGNELLGAQNMRHGEIVIGIDSLLVSHESIANIDEAMNHYDVRSEYAHKMGQSLAIKTDTQLLQVAVNCARASATLTGGNGGTALTDADANTNGASLVATAYTVAQTFDEKDVPENDRALVLKPAQYYLVVQEKDVIDTDYSSGNGDYAKGNVKMVGGLQIVKSNHVPSTNIAAAETGVSSLNTYHGNFATTVAVAMHRSAIGTVKLLDLAVEKEYQIRTQSTLMVAKYAMGHGYLRPEAAVEIKTA